MQQQKKEAQRPQQEQSRPGSEEKMTPKPDAHTDYKPGKKMAGKKVVITGGDSGIGKAVSILLAKEGADIAIIYLNENEDAEVTKNEIEKVGQQCHLYSGDLKVESFCKETIEKIGKKFGTIDVLINNAAMHWESKSLEEISSDQLIQTFQTNIFSMFYVTTSALKYMKEGASIINTSSVTAYRGSPHLIDYAATKGAIVAFTRSLASNLVNKKIRVNGVAPGPIWTPLIASSFDAEKVAEFGSDVPMKRAGQPAEVAPAYLFLASEDSSYMTGQFLHPNGGEIVNG